MVRNFPFHSSVQVNETSRTAVLQKLYVNYLILFSYNQTIQNGHADSRRFRLQSRVPGWSEVVRCDPTAGPSPLLTLPQPGKTTGRTTTCTITYGAGLSCCPSIVRSQQLTANPSTYNILDGFHH